MDSGKCRGDLCPGGILVPSEDGRDGVGDLGDDRGSGLTAEREARAAQQQVGQMDDILCARQVTQLAGAVGGKGPEWPVIGILVDEGDDLAGCRSVAFEEGGCGILREPPAVLGDPLVPCPLGHRIPGSAADRTAMGRDDAGPSEQSEGVIGEVGGGGTEGGPLAADEADHRGVRRPGELLGLDTVIARDEAGSEIAVAGKRADTREAVHDLRAVDGDVGEDVPDEVDEVVNFGLGAHRGLCHVVLEVGGADQDASLERVDEHDATVAVFEEDLSTSRGCQQLRVIEHDVRPLGAAHEGRRRAERTVGEVGPGSGCVDHDRGAERELGTCLGVAKRDRAVRCPHDFEVVRGPGAVATGGTPVAEQIERESLRVVHRGIPVGRGVLDGLVDRRKRSQRTGASAEGVAGNTAAAARERVVDRKADLDQRGAALDVLSCAVTQETEGRRKHPRERGEDRDRRLQRTDVVGSRGEQIVAFRDRLVHKPELAVLEVTDAAVDHVRRRC